MLKRDAGKTMDLPQQTNGKYLEHRRCEIVRGLYQAIHTSSLDKFTFSSTHTLHNDLNRVLQELDLLPEDLFKKLIEVIIHLSEARNELRLARFLFDVEEMPPLHRLILRNKAILRGEELLHRALQAWPAQLAEKESNDSGRRIIH